MIRMLRRKIGNFYLVGKLGSGSMSGVYLAIDPKSRQKRAFKISEKRIRKFSSEYTRFLREVELIRSLEHPSIIKIFDKGVLDDCCYYSMEHMPGGNLECTMGCRRKDIRSAVALFLRICLAMAHVHSRGIIHRNLKPSNILLDCNGQPVVSDFGIAKSIAIERTALIQSGKILGTIAYLAPEQKFDTKQVDQRADVYALGAMLYEMVMGFPPLGKFPWPSEVLKGFSGPLQSILEKCLAIKPENRFAHAGLLAVELEKCEVSGDFNDSEISAQAVSTRDSTEITGYMPKKKDRIEKWLNILRTGTTRERLTVIREMVDTIESSEVNAVLKLYTSENDRVRWGLIRVLGDLKVPAATPLIINDLGSPFHAECALEALGNIGSREAFHEIVRYLESNPENARIALIPMAQTGGTRAIPLICRYLTHETTVLRQTSVRALAGIKSVESLQALKDRSRFENDEKVRRSLDHTVCSLESELLPRLNVHATNPIVMNTGQV